MVWLTDARTPEGMRLYAIGDVHGCLDALLGVHRAIEADLDARPVHDWRVIHLGDYVDRGPDSCGVVEYLAGRAVSERRMLFLRGNHDQMFERGLAGDRRLGETWLNNGGVETLESYGVDLMDFLNALRAGDTADDRIPEEHRAFLRGLHDSVRLGDYYFVHAGVDPERPLDDQDEQALLWIREPFLSSEAQLEAVVVHGHTPAARVEARLNRIGIDTGIVFGGTLSCLVLEGSRKALLEGGRLAPLASASAPAQEPEAAGGVLARMLRLPLRFGRRG